MTKLNVIWQDQPGGLYADTTSLDFPSVSKPGMEDVPYESPAFNEEATFVDFDLETKPEEQFNVAEEDKLTGKLEGSDPDVWPVTT